MAENERSVSESKQNAGGNHRTILIGILVAIIFGTLAGGLSPKFGGYVAILGTLFLYSLKMIVVPLVMLSLIVGINSLGDIRHLGTVGWRTIVYYMVTTSLSVVVGLVLVNLVEPGGGMSPGESLPDATYTIGGPHSRTVTIQNGNLRKSHYDLNWMIRLKDQNLTGLVQEAEEGTVTVKNWQNPNAEYYLLADNGDRLPFKTVEGKLVSDEPAVSKSGKGLEILPKPKKVKGKENRGAWSTILEVVKGVIPKNIFKAMAEGDVLSLIFFALLFGAALSVLGDKGKAAVDVIGGLNDAIMRIVWWIMMVAPIGIFGLVAGRIAKAGGFAGFLPELVAVGKYSLTVVLGLFIHGAIILPLVLWIFGRRRPLAYAANMGTALLNAFSTASSSATLPLTMEGVEQENGISNRTASFVLPLGATINMDGTALYEAVAALFIAQVYHVDLGAGQQLVIFLTATLAAIGAAGIPEAGLVTMVVVLNSVGLPTEGIGLILAVDWLLDRFRTTVNVWGDSVGAAVIDRYENLMSEKAPGAPPEE